MGILSRLKSYWSYLTTDPLNFLLFIIYYSVCILMTLILHEISHGYVAWRCGDPTAKMMGRLSLDPRKHLDPLGTVFMVLFGFGWAKPVPVNPRNFQDYRRDDFLVSVAGIAMNLTLFLVCLALAVPLNGLLWKEETILYNGGAREFLSSSGVGYSSLYMNGGADNIALMRTPWLRFVQRFLLMFSHMNLCVGLFNLMPIPPLDGFHLLNDTLLRGRLTLSPAAFRITQGILTVLCLTGALSGILTKLFSAVEGGVLTLLLKMARLS